LLTGIFLAENGWAKDVDASDDSGGSDDRL
jgi:hypothetical protein